MQTVGGNHELGYYENWIDYNARYPTPYKGSLSTNPCYYATTAGPVHVIALCTYSNFFQGSLQYNWLQNHLANAIDRVSTPWVIVMLHAPLYCALGGSYAEAELMRRELEPLMYAAGVDMIVNGHIHSYERSLPVYNFNASDPCGAVNIGIGDAGELCII